MTDADLIKMMERPPAELEPMVAMFRNLRASIKQHDLEVAVAREAARTTKARWKQLRDERAKMAAQADAISAALKLVAPRIKSAQDP